MTQQVLTELEKKKKKLNQQTPLVISKEDLEKARKLQQEEIHRLNEEQKQRLKKARGLEEMKRHQEQRLGELRERAEAEKQRLQELRQQDKINQVRQMPMQRSKQRRRSRGLVTRQDLETGKKINRLFSGFYEQPQQSQMMEQPQQVAQEMEERPPRPQIVEAEEVPLSRQRKARRKRQQAIITQPKTMEPSEREGEIPIEIVKNEQPQQEIPIQQRLPQTQRQVPLLPARRMLLFRETTLNIPILQRSFIFRRAFQRSLSNTTDYDFSPVLRVVRRVAFNRRFAPETEQDIEESRTGYLEEDYEPQYTTTAQVKTKRNNNYGPEDNIPIFPIPPAPNAFFFNNSPSSEVEIAPHTRLVIKSNSRPLISISTIAPAYLSQLAQSTPRISATTNVNTYFKRLFKKSNYY